MQYVLITRIGCHAYYYAGKNDQKENEDAPLMIKNDGPINQRNDGIELSPSCSPQPASPVHV